MEAWWRGKATAAHWWSALAGVVVLRLMREDPGLGEWCAAMALQGGEGVVLGTVGCRCMEGCDLDSLWGVAEGEEEAGVLPRRWG